MWECIVPEQQDEPAADRFECLIIIQHCLILARSTVFRPTVLSDTIDNTFRVYMSINTDAVNRLLTCNSLNATARSK